MFTTLFETAQVMAVVTSGREWNADKPPPTDRWRDASFRSRSRPCSRGSGTYRYCY
jgi:hypothetical protein